MKVTVTIFTGGSLLRRREGDYMRHEYLAGEAERKGMALMGITEFCPPHQTTLRKSYVLLYSSAKIILVKYKIIQTSARNIYSRYVYSDSSTFLLRFSLPMQQNFDNFVKITFLVCHGFSMTPFNS